MGSSLVLTGGAATAKTLKESISLTSHGFSVGDVLRWNNGSPSYVRAQADSAANAEVLGIVSANTDVNTFELTYAGYVDLPQFAGISYPVLFLSGVCAGGLTHNPPSAVGTVIKPVVTRHPTLNGYVMNNYLGTQIGGSSTIAVDEIQPVGTIMPFAGTSIPDTWLECNGATYSMSSYPELYSKLCYTTGDRAPIYGHVFTVTTSTVNYATGKSATDIANDIAAGVYLRYGVGGGPYLIAKVLSITGSGNAITLTAQVVPIYDTTSKTFVVPNLILPTGETINGIGKLNAGWEEDYVTEAVASTVSVTSFCVPNLRGRTIIGTNSSVYSSLDEADFPEVITSNIGLYPQGAHGGEEKHTLTVSELASHRTPLTTGADLVYQISGQPYLFTLNTDTSASGIPASLFTNPTAAGSHYIPQTFSRKADNTTWSFGSTGDSSPHNNMPPYLAVRYIIKAKPYTRAAIIDGVDLPYSNLLVRSTDSNSLRSELLSGVSGGDLVFYTNSGEASKTGTERMRLTVGGTLSHGGINNPLYKNYSVSIFGTGVTYASNPSYPDQLPTNLSGLNGIILSGGKSVTSSTGLVYESASGGGAGLVFSRDYGYGTYISLVTNSESSSANAGRIIERMRIDSSGNVGIGTTGPTATLDVNGTLKVGNFGGATNVMVKPNNTASTLGQVIPIIRGNYITNTAWQAVTALPAGTWFVYLTAADNSIISGVGAVDEDLHFCMAKVWTVPAGQFLRFGNLEKTPTTTDTTVGYWLDGSDALKTSATGFTEFKTTATGDSKAWASNGANISATDAPSVFYDSGSADNAGGLLNWAGYAIRIA